MLRLRDTTADSVLRLLPFRYLFASRTLSLLAAAMVPIILAFAVLDSGGSATDLGIILAGRAVTQVALLLWGGVLADRMSRAKLMTLSDLLACASQAALAVTFVSHVDSLGLAVTLGACNGAAAALIVPASKGLMPQLVPTQKLHSANAILRLSVNITAVFGAGTGGVLVAAVGAGAALFFPASIFLASAFFAARIRAAGRPEPSGETLVRDLREGWSEFRSRSWLWLGVVQFAVLNACLATVSVLGPLTARESLGGASVWSLAVASQAMGLAAGSLIAMRLTPTRPLRVAVPLTLGFVPPLVVLANGGPVWALLITMLMSGACMDVFEVLWDSTLQKHVPTRVLSRISAYDAMGSYVLGPVGLAVVGPLHDRIGAPATFAGAAALMSLVTLAVFATSVVRQFPRPADRAQAMATRKRRRSSGKRD